MRAPFPWFGGKSRAASIVWSAFGDVRNYIEPFAGSLAVLLRRPSKPQIETVNDADCFLSNFWRALSNNPDLVAYHADWPVSEIDLNSRHKWLVSQDEFVRRMSEDPDFYDCRIAGWWVWGISCWIGSGWCDLSSNSAMKGKRPHLTSLGGSNGVHASKTQGGIYQWFERLRERLRGVRVCCGDWSRVVTNSVIGEGRVTGVFLDPPYGVMDRTKNLYSVDSFSVAEEVRNWAIENSSREGLRIALCGLSGEHDMPDDWFCVPWTGTGGYGAKNPEGIAVHHANMERIWFNPNCIRSTQLTITD